MAHKYSLIQGFIVSSLLAAGSTVGLPAAAQTPPAAPPAPAPAPAEAVPAPAPTPAPVGTSPAAPAAAEPAPASPTITLVPAPAATVPPAAATTPAPAEVPVPEKPAKPGEASKLQIASADGQNKLEFHALLDADGRFFLTDKGGIGTFLVRRARPSIDAKLFRYFELTIVPEFAGSRFTILEGFGNVHLWDALQLRVGKGKPPVGLERLQSSRDTMFPETALPTLLVPNRDVGAQLHGKVADGAFEWAFGVYNGVPNGQIGETDTNDSKDVEARVFVHPFKPTDIDALKGLGLGVAGTIGNEQGPVGPYVTSGGATFFAYGSTVNGLGKRTLVTPQAYYYGGPVGAMFEVVRVRDHYATPTGATGTVGTTAWALQASRSTRRSIPRRAASARSSSARATALCASVTSRSSAASPAETTPPSSPRSGVSSEAGTSPTAIICASATSARTTVAAPQAARTRSRSSCSSPVCKRHSENQRGSLGSKTHSASASIVPAHPAAFTRNDAASLGGSTNKEPQVPIVLSASSAQEDRGEAGGGAGTLAVLAGSSSSSGSFAKHWLMGGRLMSGMGISLRTRIAWAPLRSIGQRAQELRFAKRVRVV
jgi:hypothetical protein